MLGIQDNAQGEVAYGKLIETIFSACGNKSIMRVTDANQAEFFSRTIADVECVSKNREMSMSYDENGARVQLQSDDASRTPQTRRLVLPGQIQNLKDLQAIVQINQQQWCVTKMKPHNWSEYENCSSFVSREEKCFDPRRVVELTGKGCVQEREMVQEPEMLCITSPNMADEFADETCSVASYGEPKDAESVWEFGNRIGGKFSTQKIAKEYKDTNKKITLMQGKERW